MMFLAEFHGSDAARLTAAADAVFAALVDIDRLPEWNTRIHHVIESPAPASPVAEGTEWVVQMRASGGRWPSRSRALVVDPVAHRFEYETHTDDGNPSSALWSWQVTPVDAGCELTVTWAVYPRTWGRRLLGARIRRPALINEVRTSLAGLDAHLQPSKAGALPGRS
jgi:Polyketide cyclase / dehydrase and lipid transport